MPRIRKKTSKRGTSHQRQRIQHKVAETRKKRKKEAKKNPQWKTKNPKDPGIPNAFPYKDQILAEIQEERRQASEAKQKRKEGKQAARAKGGEDASDAESDAAVDGVRSLTAGTTRGSSAGNDAMDVDAEEDDVPVLLNSDFPNLKAVLDAADVVVQVLDVRNPLAFRSTHIDEVTEGKRKMFVLNKVDTVPKETVTAWSTSLRSQFPTVLFRSASAFLQTLPEPVGKGKGKQRADDAWGNDQVLSCLKSWAKEKKDGEALAVAVVGIANAGKTSFVNSLLRKAALATYKVSGAVEGNSTTAHPQEVTLEADGKTIRLFDTPSLLWRSTPDLDEQEAERTRARDILLRSRGKIERLKDPIPVVAEIVSHASREDLMLFYNLPAFTEGDVNAFLTGLARSHSLLKKGGLPDHAGAARILLRDWNTGKFPRYTMPPSDSSSAMESTSEGVLAEVYANDEQILSRLPMRKDMRKAGGVVKMTPGEVERRKVVLDASWLGSESDEEDGNDSDVDEEMDELDEDMSGEDDEEGDSGDEADEDEEMGEPEEPAPVKGKRKRVAGKPSATARPVKKVAFAVESQGGKRTAPQTKPKASKVPAKATPAAKSSKPKAGAKKDSGALTTAQKTANITSKKAAVHAGEEAYDFKKFF